MKEVELRLLRSAVVAFSGRTLNNLAGKVHLPTGDLHRVLEAHCEYGPIGAIWLEIGDAGRESLNGEHDVAGGVF